MASPDWSLIRSFLAVAEHGSFSAAARDIGISQPTIGRHIRELEAVLGLDLFQRESHGQSLTPEGITLLDKARDMQTAAKALELAAEGQSAGTTGTVRITASVVVSHFLLPPILARLRTTHPGIQIELVPSDLPENLLFREADIAIRMFRPTQLDIVTAHVADQEIGLYASHDYLARRGTPQTLTDFMDHEIVGFDRSALMIRTMKEVGLEVTRDFFPVRCDDQAAFWHLVVAGCGIGGMQTAIGDAEPRVVRILRDFPLPSLPLWLAAPQAIRHSPRIQLVWDALTAGFRAPLP
ncbi:LysR family transcriptional regulator [Shimia biformata]|uniref:LysR family transcriptional regulator n=1 Tax=Shimia biformata TaxID=1294299 RepID=UPI00194EBF4F|nr:LysR family transcriptional regulator [Shimia biformata]